MLTSKAVLTILAIALMSTTHAKSIELGELLYNYLLDERNSYNGRLDVDYNPFGLKISSEYNDSAGNNEYQTAPFILNNDNNSKKPSWVLHYYSLGAKAWTREVSITSGRFLTNDEIDSYNNPRPLSRYGIRYSKLCDLTLNDQMSKFKVYKISADGKKDALFTIANHVGSSGFSISYHLNYSKYAFVYDFINNMNEYDPFGDDDVSFECLEKIKHS